MSYQPPFAITAEIIDLIAEISELMGEIKHFNESHLAVRLRKISKIKTITGTLQIEGNTLSEQQVTALLEGKRVLGTMREIAEVKGAIEVYNRIEQFDYKKLDDLLGAHKLLMGEILNHAGHFRAKSVGVYGAQGVTHVAPPANQVSGLMAELFAWLNHAEEHPLVVSSVFHYEFEFIHPFIDGNGRMGRLWQHLILQRWRESFALVPVESMLRDHQQGYYQALEQAGQDGNCTIFVLFMLKTIRESIVDVKRYGDQVSDQVSDQVERLLACMSEVWMSATELMELVNISHKATFRKNYLIPALERGDIEMYHPDSPRSPKQKYRKVMKP
jgi:Fic family protein